MAHFIGHDPHSAKTEQQRELRMPEIELVFWASLTYKCLMKSSPITVAETHGFVRAAARIWSGEELAELIDHLAHNPCDGDIIPGTGGVRKLRWGKAGLCQGTGNRPDGR